MPEADRNGSSHPFGAFSHRKGASSTGGNGNRYVTSITVRVPLSIRRRPGRKTIVMPVSLGSDDNVIPTWADPALAKALARAFRYQRLLDDGRYASISEMAEAEKIERGYLGSLIRLTLLVPDIVQAAVDGRAPNGLVLPALLEPIPAVWEGQRDDLVRD